MRYIIFDEPPTATQVIERGERQTTSSDPVWYPHQIELVFPPPRPAASPADTPRTSVLPRDPDVTADSTQLVAGLRWVDRDESFSRMMMPWGAPAATAGTAMAEEDETRFGSTILEEESKEEFSLASAVFPPPSQLPPGRASHETQASDPTTHEQAQHISASFLSSASTATPTTRPASQIDVGLPPTLHLTLASLTPFDRFHSLLQHTTNAIHRLSILCVAIDISGPRTVGPGGDLQLWEWTALDPLSAPSMPVKISLWEGVGRTLSQATRRGDVVLLTKMTLKLYRTNLQLSTSRETQLQICWRTQVVQEYDLLFRFHEYWAQQTNEAKTVLAMKDAYSRWLGR
ncbi:BZ3500_MvSof-1268-A1-R1_Chr8-1g09851 [Microbotryum saponariae]|uniref:BZ3500_MvSof-1268-A1-R1_Chr8-1g09851 protein n=1 Tax=Microbotryum saponariae TaxID=289078 RepID=A0A2X0NQN9_9BASI|nr:BZ3500_MvSof-1268-A1-R1_Chr8-1g09851 [Microbotryum saponariae]SDA08137.1 BZ3501_MvSof-1269-A2-R1_Chr8-1g09574 [Microbotryum saponariae]